MNDFNLDSLENSAIKSRHDFIKFLNSLLADYRENGGNWENQNLEHFLEALATYTADVDGYYYNMAKNGGEQVDINSASWRIFADILRGASMYE